MAVDSPAVEDIFPDLPYRGLVPAAAGVGNPARMAFITRDSGQRQEYDSGMVRDLQEGKPRFDLLIPDGIPFGDQFLTRLAGLMLRGKEKYGERNWEKADSREEMDRFRASALRHMLQWMCGENDEDHAAAVVFNLLAYESVKWKTENS